VICVEKNSALEDISQHFAVHGPKKWKGVRTRYPTISESSFWRLVREAKAQCGERELANAVGRNLTEYALAETGDALDPKPTRGGCDYLAQLRGLYRDANRLRAHALNADESVRNPAALDRSIKIRLKLLSKGVRLEQQIRELVRMQNFFDAVIDEIAAEAPGTARRVVDRLRGLNQSTTP
jgi:hypothetical protein